MKWGKRGLIFIVDVVLGFSIIVVGFLMIATYYYTIPLATQSSVYSEDFLIFLTSTQYSELTGSINVSLLTDGFIYESESVGESLSRLCYEKQLNVIGQIMNETLDKVVPSQLKYQVNLLYLNETSLNCSFGTVVGESFDSDRLTVSRSLILSHDESFNFIGPYILEVKVW